MRKLNSIAPPFVCAALQTRAMNNTRGPVPTLDFTKTLNFDPSTQRRCLTERWVVKRNACLADVDAGDGIIRILHIAYISYSVETINYLDRVTRFKLGTVELIELKIFWQSCTFFGQNFTEILARVSALNTLFHVCVHHHVEGQYQSLGHSEPSISLKYQK